MTMHQDMQDFLGHQQTLGRTEKTIHNYKQRLSYFRLFCHECRIKTLRNVTIATVRAYHDSLIAKDLMTGTRLSYLSCISQFLRWAHENRKTLTDLASQIELPEKEESLPPTPLTLEQVEMMFGSIETVTFAGIRNRCILELLYGCGLRSEEVLRLNVGDVNAVDETLFVRGKGEKDRVVPVNQTSLQWIATMLLKREGRPVKASRLFVTIEGKRLDRNNLDRLFFELNKRLPFHINPHLLRHTCACHLLQNGADIRHVQQLLGHNDIDTTSRYLGLVKADLKQAYDTAIEKLLQVT